MPTFKYYSDSNLIEMNGIDEIILTKQKAALTISEKLPISFKNVVVQGVCGLTLWKKIKLLWKLWRFIK